MNGDPLLPGRVVDGAAFILDGPTDVPGVWGAGGEVLWAAGESLLLVGPQGVGKTTTAGQLTLARLGLGRAVLGMPVAPGRRRVLYLAMDRPAQVRRSFARMVGEADRAVLADRLVVWPGPPPDDLALYPELLAELAAEAEADTVVLDSLKDAALGLAKDETGAGYNRARQAALVAGVELLELHHQRKATGENRKPRTLADVFGSTWITAGAGSVILLWGEAGDPVVELEHLKPPAEQVGPFKVRHNHDTGTTVVVGVVDLFSLVRASVGGLTVEAAARAMFSTVTPTDAQREKARRGLESLVREGLAHRVDGQRGGAGGSVPARYCAPG